MNFLLKNATKQTLLRYINAPKRFSSKWPPIYCKDGKCDDSNDPKKLKTSKVSSEKQNAKKGDDIKTSANQEIWLKQMRERLFKKKSEKEVETLITPPKLPIMHERPLEVQPKASATKIKVSVTLKHVKESETEPFEPPLQTKVAKPFFKLPSLFKSSLDNDNKRADKNDIAMATKVENNIVTVMATNNENKMATANENKMASQDNNKKTPKCYKRIKPPTIVPENIPKCPTDPPPASSQPPDSSGPPPSHPERPIRGEPGQVYLCLIPYDWVAFFQPKTGFTGFGTFCFTLGIYLVSKEKYVMEHEYYGGLSMFIMSALAVKYIGPQIAQMLDKQVDDYQNKWDKSRVDENQLLIDSIKQEEDLQYSQEGQLVLVEAKRENVDLQLEAEYRQRQMDAYQQVKDLLDYQVDIAMTEKKFAHRNMVEWVHNSVLEAITPELNAQYIESCLETLKTMAAASKTNE